ncbi:SCO family protein [Galbibacter sp. EGI 63066]|uniref:SCO family protein n=1 Tax=Galbibacter sp. EGI 63066 TaxID=2993559 RepID=UPI0022499C34|nr:SCO family protein [Galbibacter sp. EGI 63066]MCX2681792.1 SCO family protein [Galbibacter sp. EGI 63066]
MKNKSYILIGFVVLVFGIIFVPKIVERFKNNEVVDSDRHAVGTKKVTIEDLAKMGKVPDFEFVNQHGDTISNADYEGKVYVVEFFFTTCPSICPIMNTNMVKLQNQFKDEEDFAVASFTINPEHDTPEVLKEYADKYGVTNPNWHMMTGDMQHIYALSNTGFNLYAGVNENVDGGFEHSGFFALIDRDGYIRSRNDDFGNPIVYYDGTEDKGVQMIAQDIKTLLKDK